MLRFTVNVKGENRVAQDLGLRLTLQKIPTP